MKFKHIFPNIKDISWGFVFFEEFIILIKKQFLVAKSAPGILSP